MAQYIDKDALVAEITKIYDRNRSNGFIDVCDEIDDILSFIDTLEVKEIDIEKEVIDWWNAHYSSKAYTFEGYTGHYVENSTLIEIAKHFFELGLSVSSTKVTTSDIDDVLKENGVNPYSKEAKIIKESYFMAIENLAQKGEKV